ncbi:MAG TPA: peptidase M56, partial [Pelotomaculum sp.]|nr:peptidase M56 [Pelotomaculum sp.]
KGNSFEKVTGRTLNEWLAEMIQADSTEESLSKLEPEQVIEEYFVALDKKDAKTAGYCLSKKTLLGNLTSNMPNEELFNEGVGLPLTDSGVGAPSNFDNLKSVKLLKAELIDEPDNSTKIFRVTMDIQYHEDRLISSGEQFWDCSMVYESPQTGWKIEGFGH